MINPKLSAMLLCAGIGSRLRPLTDDWPKCLMPIKKIALLEYWLSTLDDLEVEEILVNTHHHFEKINKFLNRPKYHDKISVSYEKTLLGTAGTLFENREFFKDKTVFVAHADNLCQCDFKSFVNFHFRKKQDGCLITMMTFETDNPRECGIVKKDKHDIVQEFHEKVNYPAGNTANGAVYIMEPEILDWIYNNQDKKDLSTQIIPEFLGKIAAWHNHEVHRDIGSPKSLKLAQLEARPLMNSKLNDDWQKRFNKNKIHDLIKKI